MKEVHMKKETTVKNISPDEADVIAENKKTSKKKPSARQTAALLGVAFLALLYVITLIAAVTDSSASGAWFRASLGATMALPLLLWIYIWLYGKFTGKRTLSDPPSSVTDSTENQLGSLRKEDAED